MTITQLLTMLWRQRLVFGVLVLLTLGSTVLFLSSAQKTYTATASVGVFPATTFNDNFGEVVNPLLGTLVDLTTSEDNLRDAQRTVPNAPPVTELRQKVSAQVVVDTFVLRVNVDDSDPVLAADLANAVARALPNRDLFRDQVEYRVVTEASAPDDPSSPQSRLVYALGLVLALGLGTAGALVQDGRRRRVDRPEELADLLGAPVLAQLRGRPGGRRSLASLLDDEGSGLRALRIAVSALGPPSSIVVTSLDDDPDPAADGWVAEALALALAGTDLRVLLVRMRDDATDEPIDDHASGSAAAQAGLTEVLRGAPLATAVRERRGSRLQVLTVGREADVLSVLLDQAFPKARQQLFDGHDVVVLDAPPLAESDHARVLAQDGVVLGTAQLGHVTARGLAADAAAFAVVRAHLIGCVLVQPSARGALRRATGR